MSWRFFFLILFAAYVVSLAARSLQSTGNGVASPVNFAHEPGQFRFSFSGQPTVTANEVDTVHGRLTMTTTHWQNPDASHCETVIYMDLPSSDLVDSQLIATGNGAETDGYKIVTDSVVTFGPQQLKARAVLLENKDTNLWLRLLLIVKGTRLYMVSLTAPKEPIDTSDAKLATFQLTP